MLHTGALLSFEEEQNYLSEDRTRLPYGLALWPSAIALSHDLATRADDLRGATILELGAGTGLPGMVAASLGARVIQTDHNELALTLGRANAEHDRAGFIEYRAADWTDWTDTTRYDWIIGADILYGAKTQPHVRRIFENNLADRGRVLVSDPFRSPSLKLLEAMEASGWQSRSTNGPLRARPRRFRSVSSSCDQTQMRTSPTATSSLSTSK